MQGSAVDGEEDEEDYVPVTAPPTNLGTTVGSPLSPPNPNAANASIEEFPLAVAPPASITQAGGPVEANKQTTDSGTPVENPATPTSSGAAQGAPAASAAASNAKKRGSTNTFRQVAKQHSKSGFDSDEEVDGESGKRVSPRLAGIRGSPRNPSNGNTTARGSSPRDRSPLMQASTSPTGMGAPGTGSPRESQSPDPTATGSGNGSTTPTTSLPKAVPALPPGSSLLTRAAAPAATESSPFVASLKKLLEKQPRNVSQTWSSAAKCSANVVFPSYSAVSGSQGRARSDSTTNPSPSSHVDPQGSAPSETPRDVATPPLPAATPRSILPASLLAKAASLSTQAKLSEQGSSARVNSKMVQLDQDVYEAKRQWAQDVLQPTVAMLSSLSSSADSMTMKVTQAKSNLTWSADVGSVLNEAIQQMRRGGHGFAC